MNVAFDYDDTLDLAYPLFSVISNALVQAGHEVYIVTHIDEGYRAFREKQLKDNNIAYTELVITGDKLYECQKRGVEYIFDDCEEYYTDLPPVWLQLFSIPPALNKTLEDGTEVEVGPKNISSGYMSGKLLYYFRTKLKDDKEWSKWKPLPINNNKNRLNNIKSQLGMFNNINDLNKLWEHI